MVYTAVSSEKINPKTHGASFLSLIETIGSLKVKHINELHMHEAQTQI